VAPHVPNPRPSATRRRSSFSGARPGFTLVGMRHVGIGIAGLFVVTACSSDAPETSAPPGSTNAPKEPTAPGPSPAETFPPAEGDPCRGEPLPTAQHHVPSGLCARVIASGLPGLRQLTFAPNGDLFGTSSDRIWLLRDADGDGVFAREEVHVWDASSSSGNNVVLDGGFLYTGSNAGVRRFAYDPAALKGPSPEDVVTGQPTGGHWRRTVRVYDGFLYVGSGSAGNATNETSRTEYDTRRSLIKRFDLSKLVPGTPFRWDAGEVVTVGLRNPNGFVRNETTKKIYAVVNGLDNQVYDGNSVVNDNPGEQLVEVATGKKYGYPFCFTAQRIVVGDQVVAPGTQLLNPGFTGGHDAAWCGASSSPPTTFFQAHTAPLDIVFFDQQPQGNLPEKWRGGAFVALHGSWNRSQSTGFKVVWQPFNADGTAPLPTSTKDTTTFPHEVVFGGGDATAPKDGGWSWQSESQRLGEGPRPAGVAIGPRDGALYVATDEDGGYLYRIGLKK